MHAMAVSPVARCEKKRFHEKLFKITWSMMARRRIGPINSA